MIFFLVSLLTTLIWATLFGSGRSLTEIGSNLKSNNHSQVKLIQIPDTNCCTVMEIPLIPWLSDWALSKFAPPHSKLVWDKKEITTIAIKIQWEIYDKKLQSWIKGENSKRKQTKNRDLNKQNYLRRTLALSSKKINLA